jgi:quercetin dioxygenase-like cupin family protein
MENPSAGEIEKIVVSNEYFRNMFYTYSRGPEGTEFQLGAMALPTGAVIPREIHPMNKQSFMVYEGECLITTWKGGLPVEQRLSKGDWADIIPGTEHEVRNAGSGVLKLLTEYNPAHHPPGRIDKTFDDAEARERAEVHPLDVCFARGCTAAASYQCAGCRVALYCCTHCQAFDWYRHAGDCSIKK